jgi:hypothetical protein
VSLEEAVMSDDYYKRMTEFLEARGVSSEEAQRGIGLLKRRSSEDGPWSRFEARAQAAGLKAETIAGFRDWRTEGYEDEDMPWPEEED